MDRSKAISKAVGHVAGIDLLRFCAALAVVFYHLTVAIVDPTSVSGRVLKGRALYPEAYRFAWPGFIGVEIFFVISGMVIAYSALDQTPWRFLYNRALRLYPAAWTCLSISAAVCGVLGVFTASEVLWRWAGSMLLLPKWSVDSVCWTLGVEMVFYFGVFLTLSLASSKYLYRFGVAIGLASAIYFLVGRAFWPDFLVNHLFNWMTLSLLPYGLYFGLGMVLFLKRDGLGLFDMAFIGTVLAASCIEISLKTVVNHVTLGVPLAPVAPTLVFVAAVGFMALSLRLQTPKLVTRAFRVLGLATYPLYLLHDVTGSALLRMLRDAGCGRWAALGASLAILIAASVAISRWVEPAIRSALRPRRGGALPGRVTVAAS